MHKDDLFRIASQTKAIVSTAIMILYEAGKFTLDGIPSWLGVIDYSLRERMDALAKLPLGSQPGENWTCSLSITSELSGARGPYNAGSFYQGGFFGYQVHRWGNLHKRLCWGFPVKNLYF